MPGYRYGLLRTSAVGEVIDYVTRKYGEDHVAQIVTFGTMAARGAIRDVGRALNITVRRDGRRCQAGAERDAAHDARRGAEGLPELRKDVRGRRAQVQDADRHGARARGHAAQRLDPRRRRRHHAAARSIRLCPARDERRPRSSREYTMDDARGARAAQDGLPRSAQPHGHRRTPSQDDPAPDAGVLDRNGGHETTRRPTNMLAQGHDHRACSSSRARALRASCAGLRPQSIEDITAVVALYRPGPMQSIPRYIECRHHPEKVTYKHPLLEPILGVTYGCMIYQEQVMQVFQ